MTTTTIHNSICSQYFRAARSAVAGFNPKKRSINTGGLSSDRRIGCLDGGSPNVLSPSLLLGSKTVRATRAKEVRLEKPAEKHPSPGHTHVGFGKGSVSKAVGYAYGVFTPISHGSLITRVLWTIPVRLIG
jgi:hypothetical protein